MEQPGWITQTKLSLGKMFQVSAYGLTPLMKWEKGDLTDDQINLYDPEVRKTVNATDSKYHRTALIYACRSLQPLPEILRKVYTLIDMGTDVRHKAVETHDTDYNQPDGSYKALDYIEQQKGNTSTIDEIKKALTDAEASYVK